MARQFPGAPLVIALRSGDLGFLVPGAVITLVGALSSPASMAASIQAQKASSISK